MARLDPVRLEDLRAKLGIETDNRGYIDCPFCGGKKKLHFSDEKQQWNCFTCHASGHPLHFYSKYQLGIDLPLDKSERSKISQELQRFMGYDDPTAPRPKAAPLPQKRVPASDTQCHTVYSAMASLAMFQLTPEHKKELKRRGLTSTQIERNGYRTFPFRTTVPPQIVDLYNKADPALKVKHTQKDAAKIQLGLYVAQHLLELGHKLNGIPGFYKFGNNWCLYYMPGLMIPTRNIHGQIVRWQMRCNYGDAKYKTFSCSHLPEAVTDGVARCHFPLKNAPLSNEVRVIFTEGPLKADVAIGLSDEPCVYAAIHGINNVDDLHSHCRMFKEAGVKEVYNALDMDRLTNPNVRDGSLKLKEGFEKRGIQVIPMYWAEEYAAQQLMFYQSIAYARGIRVPPHNFRLPVFEKLDLVADALARSGIVPGKATADSQYWEPDTKGIDDWLYSQTQRKEHTHKARTNHIRTYRETLLKQGQSQSE